MPLEFFLALKSSQIFLGLRIFLAWYVVLLLPAVLAKDAGTAAQSRHEAGKSDLAPGSSAQSFEALRLKYVALPVDSIEKEKFARAACQSARQRAIKENNPLAVISGFALCARYDGQALGRLRDAPAKSREPLLQELRRSSQEILSIQGALPKQLSRAELDDAWAALNYFRFSLVHALEPEKADKEVRDFNCALEARPWYQALRQQFGKKSFTVLNGSSSATLSLPPTWLTLGNISDFTIESGRVGKGKSDQEKQNARQILREVFSSPSSVEQVANITLIVLDETADEKRQEAVHVEKLKGKGVITVHPPNADVLSLSEEYATMDGLPGFLIRMNFRGASNWSFTSSTGKKKVIYSIHVCDPDADKLYNKTKNDWMQVKFKL
jgi:hypothetical protein